MITDRIIAAGMLKTIISILVLMLVTGLGSAKAQTGHLQGTITDASTGDLLIGANIMLSGTSLGAATNVDGRYSIRNLPAGDQVFTVRYVGYRSREVTITIVAGETVEYDISLDPDVVEGEEIVVYSQALAQANAIQRQLAANTIVNVVSESRLRELPDVNAAESVGRLPGVSIIRSAGEGQKVAIRGLGPQYNSVTIDGDRVTSTDLGGRSVDMSMISPEMLSGIELYKVLRPDMDADAIGGSVNFSFSGAPSENQYRVSLSSGYHNQISGIGTYKASASGSSRFFDDRLGVLATVSSQRVDRSSHVFDASYQILRSALEGEPHAPMELRNARMLDRQETRERHGAGLNLDLNIPGGRLYTNNFYSRLNRDEVSLRRGYHVNRNTQDWQFRDRDIHVDVLTSSLGGEHAVRGGLFHVDWRVSRNVSSQDHPYDNTVLFRERNALNRDIYRVGMGPDEVPEAHYNRLENTAMYTLSHGINDARERDYNASVNVEVPVRFGPYVSGSIKTGGKYFDKDRFRESRGWIVSDFMFRPTYPTYPIIQHESFPMVPASDGNPSIIPFMEDNPYTVLDGQYEMRLRYDRALLNSMWDNTGHLYYNQLSNRLNDYRAHETVTAGYIMAELDIGRRLMILPGVRYEHDRADYEAVSRDFAQNNAWGEEEWQQHEDALEDVKATREEGMWFPMVQARYRATDWFDVRLARTQSTSRPSYSQLTPRRIINPDARTVSRGRPDLVLPKATNYDAIVTIHNNRVGLVSVGGFYKEIENLVFNRETVAIDPEAMGLPFDTRGYRVNEPENNPNTTKVHGFEVEWQSNLMWLPSPLSGLVFNVNYSRIFSETQYPGFRTERTPQGTVVIDTFRAAPMVHQPDYIANVSVGYDIRGFSARISMLYQGSTLAGIGARPEEDLFIDDYLRWDLALKQNFLGGMASFFVNVQNLSNRRDFSMQFTEQFPRTMQYYGWTMDMGVRFQL
jgi:TonB-dependent receptor